ncbi:fumarylacetoacetate hydrolase family protein [Streptomyces sp. NPDC055140]
MSEEDRVGLLQDDTVYGLTPGQTMLGLLSAAGGSDELRVEAERALRDPFQVLPFAEVQLRAPIPRPGQLRDALCYLGHLRACQVALGGTEALAEVWKQVPALYQGNERGIVASPYDPVPVFPGSTMFDFELEIGIVLGRGGRDIPPDRARELIAGYTLMCDWSARDHQLRERQLGIGLLKAKDAATTLGPWLLTVDEFDEDTRLSAYVNGQLIGSGKASDRRQYEEGFHDWDFPDVIAYASRGVDLEPGDVIGSGTIPGGCLLEHFGAADFRGWLKPGDVVRLTGGPLGTISQTVIPAPPMHRLASGY